jgi:hypothetical protein
MASRIQAAGWTFAVAAIPASPRFGTVGNSKTISKFKDAMWQRLELLTTSRATYEDHEKSIEFDCASNT